MLSTPIASNKSLPLVVSLPESSNIDDAIASLGFIWNDEKWVKDLSVKNKFTVIAHPENRMFNKVFPADQLLDLSASQWLQSCHPPPEPNEDMFGLFFIKPLLNVPLYGTPQMQL